MSSFVLSDLDHLAEDAMAKWGVPGLAIAVVHGDEPALIRSYGTSDIATGAAVTPDTQFMICSLSKSFTAAGLALLVDEQKLGWDTAVREVLPEFQLYDAVASDEVTVSDLLAHRSGLPAHDRVWSPPERRSRSQLLHAMRYLEPSDAPDRTFQYSNLGYLVAGMIAERISGLGWEAFTEQRLLSPLGFSNVGFSIEDLVSAADHAHPHVREGSRVYPGTFWPMHATPAGGINASVADMARWLRFLLSNGCVDGVPIVSPAAVAAMMAPHIYTGTSEFAEIGQCHYGFGLTCGHYRDDRTVSHTGSQPGWGTMMSMMPDHRIGVVVLTNRDSSPVRELLIHWVFDRLRSRVPVDWLQIFDARRRTALQEEENERRREAPGEPWLQHGGELAGRLAGEYEHPAYGRLSITDGEPGKGRGWRWRWRGLGGALVRRGNDLFQLKEDGEPRYASGLQIRVERDGEGIASRLRSPLEPAVPDIIFERK